MLPSHVKTETTQTNMPSQRRTRKTGGGDVVQSAGRFFMWLQLFVRLIPIFFFNFRNSRGFSERMVEMANMQAATTEAAAVILYLSAAICSGSGSRRKLEPVQARSLFTFTSGETDGAASFFSRRSLCVRCTCTRVRAHRSLGLARHGEVYLCGSFDKPRSAGKLWQRDAHVDISACTRTHARGHLS